MLMRAEHTAALDIYPNIQTKITYVAEQKRSFGADILPLAS